MTQIALIFLPLIKKGDIPNLVKWYLDISSSWLLKSSWKVPKRHFLCWDIYIHCPIFFLETLLELSCCTNYFFQHIFVVRSHPCKNFGTFLILGQTEKGRWCLNEPKFSLKLHLVDVLSMSFLMFLDVHLNFVLCFFYQLVYVCICIYFIAHSKQSQYNF